MGFKENALKFANRSLDFASKNAPSILTALAVGATVGAVITAVTGTIKAVKEVEEDKEDFLAQIDERVMEEVKEGKIEATPEAMDDRLNEIFEEEYTWKNVVAVAWPHYIPTVALTLMATGCAIGSQSISARRQAAAFALYETAQNTLKTYQEKVLDEVGKNKEKKIRHAVHEEELRRNPPNEGNVYNCNKGRCGVENGEALFREPQTGQYFVSTYEKVRRAVRKVNDGCHKDSWYNLSDLFDDMGADPDVGSISDLGFPGVADPAADAIDEDYLFDPHLGEFMGHEVTIVYMSYYVADRKDYDYSM